MRESPTGSWLAIDTATDHVGLALLGPGAGDLESRRLVVEKTIASHRLHTVTLAPEVAAILERHVDPTGGLAGIAVAIGPGSYTGLRVGLALAKGIAMAWAVPIVAVPTLDIVAVALSPPVVPRSTNLWCVLQAGRGRVIAAAYDATGARLEEPSILRPEAPADFAAKVQPAEWVAGELDARVRDALRSVNARILPEAAGLRRPGWLAFLGAARRTDAVEAEGMTELGPIYASPSDAQ